jgi:hypothetical protein
MPAAAIPSKPATPSKVMKLNHLVPAAALAVLLATGCNKKSPDVTAQLAELERKATEAVEQQRRLEQQLEEQKLAAERDAIERERMQIEEARAELERQQGDAAAAEEEQLRQREIDLAAREGKVELIQSRLEEQEDAIQQRDQELSDRDRELAGREALALEDANNDEPAAPVGDFGMFYDSLSSYGSWFETPDYGYVWQPVIVRDSSWRPYTRGRWACTDRGWTWISDEPFGWATYHYGRWALCRGYGWIWVPGTDWAPSWVSWRSSGSHIGWAPLPPETLAYRNHRWDSTVDVTCGIGASWFNFVEVRNFGYPIHHHCLPYTQNGIYIGQTVNITNIHIHNRRVICGGPSYGDIERQTARKPPFYRIEEDRHGRPGRDMRAKVDGQRLRVAAPNLDVAWNEGLKPNKIKGRMESIKVERQEELRPEVTERFRQSREDNRRKAEQSILELGGKEKFNQGRMQALESNRRKAEETAGRTEKEREARPRTEPGKTAGTNDLKTEPTAKREDGPRSSPAMEDNPQARASAERLRKQQQEIAEQARQRAEARRVLDEPGKRANNPQIAPSKDRRQPTEEAAARIPKPPEETAAQPGKREESPRTVAPKDRNPVTENASERARKSREEAASQPGKRQDAPRIAPPAEGNRQAQDDSAARMRRQQEEQQAERARQQQQEAARQRDQARQQQIEEAKREQARQQQQEAARQREQARQQQMEESRREQAREQARQQQMEESRREQAREQARQQQMEENRREQQREQARQQQQEENRREQARQQQKQQEESQRQQRSRQDQRQEEERRGRNR